MPLRIDSARPFRAPEKTAQGYLKAEAVIATVGIVRYEQPDGTVRRELRLPEEVFRADSLKTAEMIPVTSEHPPKMLLNAENTKQFQVGSLGEARVDGNLVVAPILITDKKSVDEVLARKRDATSPGYLMRLDATPGVHPTYGEYDAIQRDIRFNHLALTREGRQGSDVRVRLDSEDAEQVDDITQVREDSHMRKIKINGVTIEVPEAIADVLEAGEKARNDSATALTAQLAETRATLDKLTARADSAEAQAKKLEAARNDAADPQKFLAAVQARVALVARASKVLGDEVRLDSMDESAVRVAVLAKLQPDLKLEGRSAEYVAARFDAELERHEAANPADQVRNDGEPVPQDPKHGGEHVRLDYQGAMKSFKKDTEQAWKRPLARSKSVTVTTNAK